MTLQAQQMRNMKSNSGQSLSHFRTWKQYGTAVASAYLFARFMPFVRETAAVFDGQIMLDELARLFMKQRHLQIRIEEPEPFVAAQKKTRSGYNRKEAFAALPEEEMVYKIDEAHRNCPKCGAHLDVVGKKFGRAEVNYIPARLSILNIYQETCSCPACKARTGQTAFVEPTIPEPVLQHSYASASSVAWTMYQKFVQSVPLYRQEKDWKAMGLDLGRSTLSNWIVKTSEEWLSPVVAYMYRELLKEKYLHADETPVQVLREPNKKNKTKSTCGFLQTSLTATFRCAFSITPRAGPEWKHIRCLTGLAGTSTQMDYAGYNRVAAVKRCLCGHMSRRFRDAISQKDIDSVMSLAQIGFNFCNNYLNGSGNSALSIRKTQKGTFGKGTACS
jgi:transposase